MSGIDGWHHHGSFWGRHFHIQLLEMLHDVALPSILTYDRQFRPFYRKKKTIIEWETIPLFNCSKFSGIWRWKYECAQNHDGILLDNNTDDE
mmetsp:Transcript_7/g.21  ORF Transcript_7/g.21 Transcript_7/m.21 type:complete len:92 (-) Transcript_7:116-391(-)